MITHKTILSLVLVTVIVGGVYLVTTQKKEAAHQPFTYGTFDSYFTGQDSITYPLIFDSIRIVGNQQSLSINFGPAKFEDFEIFMNVTKMTRVDAQRSRSLFVERGLLSEGTKTTQNGYVGEVLSSDLKAHPDPNTQSCDFTYRYFIPLANSADDLALTIQASQPEWGMNQNAVCIIFDEKNYKQLKDMMDYVIAHIQPAF